MTPAKAPTHREAVGLMKIPQAELIATPPASVALQMSLMANFYLTKAVVIKVETQLPVIAKMVFVMIIPL